MKLNQTLIVALALLTFSSAAFAQRDDRRDDRSEGRSDRGSDQRGGERPGRGEDRGDRGDQPGRGGQQPRPQPTATPAPTPAPQPPRRDEPRRDEPRRDEPRRDEPRRDEPRRDEPRQTGVTVLDVNQIIDTYQSISSPNGRFKLVMQGDCNLVLMRDNTRAIWDSRTNNRFFKSCRAVMQNDGNFVVYNERSKAMFATDTERNPGAVLTLDDNGRLEIRRGYRTLWSR